VQNTKKHRTVTRTP